MDESTLELDQNTSILTQGALPIIVEAVEVSKLDGKNLEDLEETFALFDIDGNGRISSHELIAVLKSVGTQYSEEDIKEMHKIADLDGDGEIGFDDFHSLMKETILRGIQDDDLYEAFKCFDSDKDGYITAAELHQSLSSLGEDIEIEDAVDMVKDIDSNGDGLIDFQEFKSYYEKGLEKAQENQENKP